MKKKGRPMKLGETDPLGCFQRGNQPDVLSFRTHQPETTKTEGTILLSTLHSLSV